MVCIQERFIIKSGLWRLSYSILLLLTVEARRPFVIRFEFWHYVPTIDIAAMDSNSIDNIFLHFVSFKLKVS